jgi:hypothetical protein
MDEAGLELVKHWLTRGRNVSSIRTDIDEGTSQRREGPRKSPLFTSDYWWSEQ